MHILIALMIRSSFLMSFQDIGMEGFTSTSVVFKDSYLMAGSRTRRVSEKANDASTGTAQSATSIQEKPLGGRLSVGGRLPQHQHRLQITSSPCKWPGVQSLRMLLSQV